MWGQEKFLPLDNQGVVYLLLNIVDLSGVKFKCVRILHYGGYILNLVGDLVIGGWDGFIRIV